jgi:hypothetical protein
MGTIELDFSKLQAPPDSGDVLVEPVPADLRARLDSCAALVRGWDVRIAGLDLQSIRRAVRLRVAGVEDERPVIVTGHQPEFIHPGVWAKHVAASRLAEAAGGVAVNLVVDTDAPKRTALQVPTFRRGRLRLESVRYAEVPAGVLYEHIRRCSREAVARMEGSLRELLGDRFERSMLGVYLEAFGGAAEAEDLVDQSVAGRRAVEQLFEVTLLERRVSRCWCCPLLVEMLSQTSRFFECYNAALGEYRRAQGIRGTHRPIPDLIRDGDRFELPIWVIRAGTSRRRLFVEVRADGLHLFADRQAVGVLAPEALQRWASAGQALDALEGLDFRPRALILMLWARMLLADLFVHGIGGAKYDRVTDLLIERYFGVTPPPMACVSATLRLDLPVSEVSASRLGELEHRLRDLRCNPQRHLPMEGEVAALARARAEAVERARRLRADNGRHRDLRRAVFNEIRSLSRRMLDARPEVLPALQDRPGQARRELEENQVATGREYFFALFDRPALQGLCDALPPVEAFRI